MHLIGKFGVFFFINVYLVNLNLKENSLQIFEISVKKNPKKPKKTVIFLNSFKIRLLFYLIVFYVLLSIIFPSICKIFSFFIRCVYYTVVFR